MTGIATLLIAGAFAVTAITAHKVVPVAFGRHGLGGKPGLNRRTGTYSQELNNNLTGGGYYAQVSLGTPPQPVALVLDTGSSDVWVLDSHADLCSSVNLQARHGGCISTYEPSKSSTYSQVSRDGFRIRFVDGSGAEGDYIRDTFSIGGASIENLQMGLAENTTINSGLLGIGFAANVAASRPYPNILDLFESEGLIDSQAYSLYLDDLAAETGTILFGGIDTDKYHGDLKAVPILRNAKSSVYSSFSVALSSLSTTAGNGTVVGYLREPIPVVLDSGTTLTYLPATYTSTIFDAFGAYDDTRRTGLVYVSCEYLTSDEDLTFDFQFGDDGPLIRVPIDELVLDNVKGYVEIGLELPPLPFDDICSFGLQGSSSVYLLGDTFLRSAYVVYDLTNKEIAIAPANWDSALTNVVEINKSSGIPDVKGVATQVTAEQTATGLPGSGGNGLPIVPITATSQPPGERTAQGTSENSGSGGMRRPPLPTWSIAALAAIATILSLAGAS